MEPSGVTDIAHHVLENPTILGLLVLVVAAGTSISLGLLWVINKMSTYRNGFTGADRSMIAHMEATTNAVREASRDQVMELRYMRDAFKVHNSVVKDTLRNDEWLKQFHCKVPENSMCRYRGDEH